MVSGLKRSATEGEPVGAHASRLALHALFLDQRFGRPKKGSSCQMDPFLPLPAAWTGNKSSAGDKVPVEKNASMVLLRASGPHLCSCGHIAFYSRGGMVIPTWPESLRHRS